MHLEKEKIRNVNGSTAYFMNAGYGADLEIAELVEIIQSVVQYKGRIIYDSTKPDGALKKLMDSSKMKSYGFKPKMDLKTGLKLTYAQYLNTKEEYKKSFNRLEKQ